MSIFNGRQTSPTAEQGDAEQYPLNDRLGALAEAIAGHSARVGVIGQGYVGFPLAQRIAEVGFTTYGIDINGATLERCAERNRFTSYHAVRPSDLRDSCDVLIVAVPTPTKDLPDGRREPDLTAVIAGVRTALANVTDDSHARLLVLESTYAPGTTRTVVAPIIAAAHDLGDVIALGYSPERIDPGNQVYDIVNTPKITSGIDPASACLTQLFYSQVVQNAVQASSMETAEATKILENAFRFVNITFAQEFEEYCERIGISAREATYLAGTKPFGFQPFFAGAGIGGHCIAEDPYYLYQSMIEKGLEPNILRSALRNHEHRASVEVERIIRNLGGRPVHECRVLILGVSYKPNIGDARRSPAEPIIDGLVTEGATVDYFDPFVPEFHGRRSINLEAAQPSDYDLAVLLTEHSTVDYSALAEAGWKIIDARIALKPYVSKRGRQQNRRREKPRNFRASWPLVGQRA